MSSSYFDAQPAKAPPAAALLDIPKGSGLANTSFMSPQVSRILEDLDLEDKSSSGEEFDNASLSEDSNSDKDAIHDHKSRRDQGEQANSIPKAQTPPLPRGGKQAQSSSHRPGLHSQKNPHLARFHSLRSMLFSSRIEDNISKQKESEMQAQAQAEAKWRAEHDLRRGLNRPKTPEAPTPPREGLTQRLKSGLKRVRSKDSPPPMARIAEDNASTASDDEEESSVQSNDEDVDDLVRWVSRRDPPSDGEARRFRGDEVTKLSKADSGHESGRESLGQSDVEELVRWVSRRDGTPPTAPQEQESKPVTHPPEDISQRYHDSDASTESDSDGRDRPVHRDSIEEDDVDDLVRWVSRREGSSAGPVRSSKTGSIGSPQEGNVRDEPTEELVRWVTKRDDTSGESEVGSQESLPELSGPGLGSGQESGTGRRGSALKRELSHTQPAAMESETALTHDDVDDLVQWVSKKQA